MAQPSRRQIRRAITAARGGHEGTSDAGIMVLWRSLDEETQKRYLAAAAAAEPRGPKKGKDDAAGNES